jgi:hypothetical protein
MAGAEPTNAFSCRWRHKSGCGLCFAHRVLQADDRTAFSKGTQEQTQATVPELCDLYLTTEGAADEMRCQVVVGLPCRYASLKPRYNADLREFWLGEAMLHRFHDDACTETETLQRFQDADWPCRIVEPLGKARSKRYGEWLKVTVYRLNQCQDPRLVRFRSQPSRSAVTWELRFPLE